MNSRGWDGGRGSVTVNDRPVTAVDLVVIVADEEDIVEQRRRGTDGAGLAERRPTIHALHTPGLTLLMDILNSQMLNILGQQINGENFKTLFAQNIIESVDRSLVKTAAVIRIGEDAFNLWALEVGRGGRDRHEQDERGRTQHFGDLETTN